MIQKPTPVVLDEVLIETSDSNKALYDRFLEVGHYHPDRIKYPAYRLLRQQPNAYGLMQYVWGNSFSGEDGYNATREFALEGNAYPTYVRSYRVLRSDYLVTGPLTKGTPFTGVAAISVTGGGTGYTRDFLIGSSGGGGTGLAGTAIVDPHAGKVIRIDITNVGTGYSSAPTITFGAGGGTGASATALVQPTTCVLVDEKHEKLPEDDPHSSLYDKVIRTWETMPGPVLTTVERSQAVRGRTVTTSVQEGLTGTLGIQTGSLIISSEVVQVNTIIDRRTTKSVASLPPDEVNMFWADVPIPLLLFDIDNTVFCNNTEFATLVTNPVKAGGASQLRKHRRTVSYLASVPNLTPDLSGTPPYFETANIEYQGKFIRFNYGNVLNDAISFTGDLYTSSAGGACFWTEAYSFSATTPSATDFAAGDWYLRSYEPEPWGDSMWKITKIEFYSAAGNPDIT